MWKSLFVLPLALLFVLLGPGSGPAWSLEPEDGGIAAEDQDPEFDSSEDFDGIDDLEDDLDQEVDEQGNVPDRIRAGGIIGIWQYTGKREGWFVGKLYVRVRGGRILVGRVKGIFKRTAMGHELAGVILDRKGDYRGVLKGDYGRRGFFARWRIADNGRKGKIKAKFVAPYGRAGFVGKFTVKPDVFEDAEEE